MSKLLRCLAGLFILCFIGNNAFAAGYNCPTYRKYTSCNSGYYISNCPTSSSSWTGQTISSSSLTTGNSCKSCPSGYTCSGGLVCPKKGSVTCSAGYYLKANATSCSACGGNNYYCPGGTFNVSSSDQGRNTVSSGHYSTGGTSTTRTGQAQCTGATYCTNGVKYNCPSGYDDNISNGKSSSAQCQIRCNAGYYLAGKTDPACTAVGIGYYKEAHLVSYGSASTRSECPASYSTESTTAGTSIRRCYLSVRAGYVRNGTTGTTLTRCAAGTYRAAHNAYYGSSYSCSTCSGRTKYSAAGAGSCSTVSTGYYTTGCDTSGNACTGQTQCSGATYCTNGMQYNCPTADSGWTRGTGTGWSSYNSCYEYRNATSISSYCASGQLRRYASSGTTWASTATEHTTFRADPGAYVSGSGINMTCTRCSGPVYSPGGDVHSCTACPTTLPVEWRSGSGTGWDSYTDCYVYRNATSISSYCSSGQLRRYASSASAWSSTATEYTTFRADPGAIVTGSGINMTCTQCGEGEYSAGGDVHACTACPELTPGFSYSATKGMSSYTECTQMTSDISAVNQYCTSSVAAGEIGRFSIITQTAGGPNSWDGSTNVQSVAAIPGAILDSRFQDNVLRVQGAYDFDNMCTQCGVGSYSAGGAATSCTACPELTPGFEYTGSAGASSYTQCFQYTNDPSTANSKCMADPDAGTNVSVVQKASSPTRWDGGVVAVGVAAKPGAILDSKFRGGALILDGFYKLSSLCTACAVGSYSPGGDVTECTACPALTPGFEYTGSAGASSYTQCAQGTNDPSVANSNCMADPDASQVAVIHTADSATSWGGSVLATGIAAKPGAILDSNFQNGTLYVEGRYSLRLLCTQCGAGEYSPGGDVTSCTACLDNYTTTGDALTDHDSASDCKITCSGGEYVPTAGDGCVNVGAGYWGAGGTVSQTSTLGRNECASGLTTIGWGSGADEAGDCGRVLNVGDEKIYLRSTKKTTPSLNISINGDVFYGNMSTATRGALRINSGGTTYSVYDDSM